ncbi:MAG: hypothetical protein ACJ0UT_04290 [Candidatus Latescibacterota bacterium]
MQRLAFSFFVMALGCGNSQDETNTIPQPVPSESAPKTETPYGDSAEVKTYLTAINPFIQEVGKIHLEVNKVVGTSGQATVANLAPAMKKARPRLQHAIESFTKIEPPPLLASLHADIKKLMLHRLDAYETTVRGWDREQDDGKLDPALEAEAEKALNAANQLIRSLNQEMAQIYQALEITDSLTQTASP